MTFLTTATSVLEVAKAALPAVTRAYLAGGPDHARLCTQLVVFPGFSRTQGVGFGAVPAGCARAVVPSVVLAYSKDCYPLVEDGRPPKLPDPADVDAWTRDYLGDCWTLVDALLEAAYNGGLGDCSAVEINQVEHRGPSGGVCTMLVPVTVGP